MRCEKSNFLENILLFIKPNHMPTKVNMLQKTKAEIVRIK